MSVSDHPHKEQKVRDLRTAPGADTQSVSQRNVHPFVKNSDSFNEKRVNSRG